MSQQTLSTTAPWKRGILLRLLISVAVSAAILALAFGPRGLASMLHLGAASLWRPHAPNFAPLVHASLVLKIHLATIAAAFAIGTLQMVGPKGRTAHRILGWAFVGLLLFTAVVTLFIHAPGPRHFGPLHLFSVVTLVSVPLGVIAIRRGDVARHARVMSGVYFGALVFAGVLAFLPGRLLWQIVFG